jgi:hypothetical protein
MRPKKPVAQERELFQARQEQLVLHGAVLDALRIGQLEHRHRFFEVCRDRLLAIDMLAGVDRLGQQRWPRLRGRGVEEDDVVLFRQRLVEVGGPARDIETLCQPFDLVGVAADQDRIRHDAVAIRQQHATLVADRDDRADQMLVESHAAGDPVHDHAEALRRHRLCSCRFFAFGCFNGDSAVHNGCTPVAKPGTVSDPVRRSPP